MSENLDTLILDLLEWVGPHPRPYTEVMDAWRTSCPRLPVWEEANDRGLLDRTYVAGEGRFVSVSAEGARFLGRRRPLSGRPADDRDAGATSTALR
jgi:hypothetical protein